MTIQDKMVGKHPIDKIGLWLEHEDIISTESKRHRYLELKADSYDDAVSDIADWLVRHHLSDKKKQSIERKKELLRKYSYDKVASELKIFPSNDNTKKGNLGEIILSEYLSETNGIDILVYKLHYNSNIDQAMKGDDVILVSPKTFLIGESKFRSNPQKADVESAIENMKNELSLPLSLSFVAEILKEKGQEDLADLIEDVQFNIVTEDISIKNIGFLMSTKKVKQVVERHLNYRNKELLFISLGIDKPVEFLNDAFFRAETLVGDIVYGE